MNYLIRNVSTALELRQAYDLFLSIFVDNPVVDNPEYSYKKWEKRMQENCNLLLYASFENNTIGIAFGRIFDNDIMVVGPVAVKSEFRNLGIAKNLMVALEKKASLCDIKSIRLGALETAENFYSKLGYTGSLLIQSDSHSIDQLLSINNKYKVKYTNIYNTTISQICLELPEPDRKLQKKYETIFTGCYTQMMYWKDI